MNNIVNKIGKKKLIIIGSVILALLTVFAITIFVNASKNGENKNTNSTINSSLSDNLLNNESEISGDSSSKDMLDDSSSNDSTATSSSTTTITDSGIPGNSTTVTQKLNSQSTGAGATTTPPVTSSTGAGATTTTPSTPTNMTFAISSFTPFAEKGVTTGLGKPVFEYIYGVSSIENGIPTKYIQQRDTVVLTTNMKVTSVDATGFITATFSGNTITVKAKGQYDLFDMQEGSITVNGTFKYNFHVYRLANYSEEMSVGYVTKLYWERKGKIFHEYFDTNISYTGGDTSKSITGRTYFEMYLGDGIWHDDVYDFKGASNIPECFWLMDQYEQKGFMYTNIDSGTLDGKDLLTFIANK